MGWTRFEDRFEPFYSGRYVSSFFRGWESDGLREYKQSVATQVSHTAGITWNIDPDFARFWLTVQVDNLTDAKLFDNFGV